MPGNVPTFDQLMNPLIRALQALGGSGSIEEIYDKVIQLEQLPEDVISHPHDPEKSNLTEVGYRLAWARTYLKKYGVLENSSRGIWALTAKAKELDKINPQDVVRTVRAQDKKDDETKDVSITDPADVAGEQEWKEKLHAILTQKLSPAGFERLVQRLLRESGFTHVEVTGRSGDGGIDGRGIARIHGLLSFHVLFQCKRYRGSVGPGDLRDFRGAMVGRADKGLFITTGTFTPAAVREAARDGAPPIDLLDGDDFSEKLRELGMGVKTEKIEVIRIQDDWFENI
jgi:restriction system protein